MQRYVLILPNGRLLDRERCFILRSDRFAMFRFFLFHPVLFAFYFHLAFLTSTLIFVSYNSVLYTQIIIHFYRNVLLYMIPFFTADICLGFEELFSIKIFFRRHATE